MSGDERFVLMALARARRGRGRTHPNPHVGAVLVKRGRVIASAHHRRAGGEHAEVLALGQAGPAARGADLYVNLEPCCHQGATGPCTEAIIRAGVRRVVVGMIDPNPLVNGRGVRALRAAGIEVVSGVAESECRAENEVFLTFIEKRRPFVTLKTAATLDGRVAARTGDARWVTGPEARRAGHRLRAEHQAVLIGVGTALADDPRLTCREIARGRDPIRIVVDSRLRTPPGARLLGAASTSGAPTWIVTTRAASATRERRLIAAGAEVIRIGNAKQVPLRPLLRALARRRVASVLLESGPTLSGALWQAGLVDRLVAFVAPKMLADPAGLPMLRGKAKRTIDQATDLDEMTVRWVGRDLMLTARPRR